MRRDARAESGTKVEVACRGGVRLDLVGASKSGVGGGVDGEVTDTPESGWRLGYGEVSSAAMCDGEHGVRVAGPEDAVRVRACREWSDRREQVQPCPHTPAMLAGTVQRRRIVAWARTICGA